MRKLIIILCLLIGFFADAQTNDTAKYISNYWYGVKYSRGKYDSVLMVPRRDTTDYISPKKGQLTFQPSDNKYYGYNGTYWFDFSGGISGGDCFVTEAYNTIDQLNDTTITIIRTDATRDTLVFETGTTAEPGNLANVSITGNYAALANDNTIFCKTNNLTVTLPTAAGRAGKFYNIKVVDNIVVTVATTSSQTIDGSLTQILNQYDNMAVISDGTNWHIL